MAFAIIVTASSTTIAADVSARNSSCGLRAQSKTMIGSAVYGPLNRSSMLPPGERAEDGADEDQRRRLAERTR